MDHKGPGTAFYRKFMLASTSLALALITSLAVAEFVIVRRSLIDEAQHHAEEMAQGLLVSELSSVMTTSQQSGKLVVSAAEAAELNRELTAFLEPFDIMSVNLVNNTGQNVFSTNEDRIGQQAHRDGGLSEALAGRGATHFELHGHAIDLANQDRNDVPIVETYLPLVSGDGQVLGAFELYTNVQNHVQAARSTWLTLVASMGLLVFCSLMALNFLIKLICNRMDQVAQQQLKNTAELAKSEKFLQLIMDSIPDDLLVINADHKVLLANKHVREKFGSDPVEANKSCFQLFHRQDSACADDDNSCPMRESAVTDEQATAIHRHTDKDGNDFHVEVVTVPIFDENGQATQFIEHCRDISHRVQYEEEISTANKELQAVNDSLMAAKAEAQKQARHAIKADKAKTVFLANMSHEMRTPLTAILGYTDLLADPDSTAETSADHLSVIRRNGKQLLALIEDILDLVKVEEGRMSLRIADCDTLGFIKEVESDARCQAANSRLDFELRYLTPVPQSILTDQARLKQALLNLISNACKFTSAGSVGLEIEFVEKADLDQALLLFHVTDTGIGITDDVRQNLFRPFTQGEDEFNRKFGGTGLGLVVTKRIGEVLGGDVTVESIAGQGSRFTLSIDVGNSADQPRVSPEVSKPAPTQPARSTVDLTGLDILYAEDMPDNQFLVGTILRKAGAKVEIAENGAIAVEKSGSTDYDMILMDIQMPEMDGLEATRIIRERGFTRPIVALTANAMENDRRLSAEAGCDQHLAKPVNRRILLETVQSHCRDGLLV